MVREYESPKLPTSIKFSADEVGPLSAKFEETNIIRQPRTSESRDYAYESRNQKRQN